MFGYTSNATIAYFFLHQATGDFRQTSESMNPKGDLIRGMFLRHFFSPPHAGPFSILSNTKYRVRHRSPTFRGVGRCRAHGHICRVGRLRCFTSLMPRRLSLKASRVMPRSQPAGAVDDSPSLLVILPRGPRRSSQYRRARPLPSTRRLPLPNSVRCT
jgi:hypothetical protein